MRTFNNPSRTASLVLCSAMAAALLSGCAGQTPFADNGNASAVRAADDADSGTAVAKAEKRVSRSPESAGARAELAQAYLAAGRFDSAATTFEDVVALGGDNARTGLGMALAYVGAGRNAEAFAVLGRWREQIPASDYGLAIALAGQPAMGVAVLTDAVRAGDDNAKTRQNLAYAYALDGRWVQARLIASQDVPADQIDARLSEWAAKARPEASRERVAGLLGAPLRADPGQPASLALGSQGDGAQLAQVEAPTPSRELPPVSSTPSFEDQPTPAASPLAVTGEEPGAERASAFVPRPVIRKIAEDESTFQATFDKMSMAKAVPAEKSRPAGRTHLVQLGSFQSRAGAQQAWTVFVKRNPGLKNHTLRVTEAKVNGHHYYRVAAEGFDRASAQAMCSAVKSRGGGCLAYSEQRPLPGAVPGRGAGATLRAR